jgi:hypothetical protein
MASLDTTRAAAATLRARFVRHPGPGRWRDGNKGGGNLQTSQRFDSIDEYVS